MGQKGAGRGGILRSAEWKAIRNERIRTMYFEHLFFIFNIKTAVLFVFLAKYYCKGEAKDYKMCRNS